MARSARPGTAGETQMPTREDFEMALALARQVYRGQDPVRQAERAGIPWLPGLEDGRNKGHAEVPFLATVYRVEAPEGEVSYRGGEPPVKEPALWEKIIVLHYYNKADGRPPAGEHISFKEIPDGRLYQPNFEKRAVAPLLGAFGAEPDKILECAASLGGRQAGLGDVSVTVPVFPRVPVTVVFWRGDEEFPPRVSILFDRTISHYLPTEDMVLASQMLAFRLAGLAKAR